MDILYVTKLLGDLEHSMPNVVKRRALEGPVRILDEDTSLSVLKPSQVHQAPYFSRVGLAIVFQRSLNLNNTGRRRLQRSLAQLVSASVILVR